MNQTQQIKAHLERGNKLTQLDAFRLFGCWRLSARIFDLRALGVNIAMKMIYRNGKGWAEYSMGGEV